ncbi:MAG: aminoacetone oxidase family FAD-binding enzyme, partial [Candidatus Sulfotelmatobacter sp.]
ALARYTPADFIALIEKHAIPYHEKTLGQLFCDRSARDVLDMLESECRDAHVAILLNTKIEHIERRNDFIVRAPNAEFTAPALVVATGGLSIPKIGATSFGYDLARKFGLAICGPRPALVPLLLSPEDSAQFCDLAGVSTEVIASCGGQQFREKMLVTHRGLSGPAILQISSYWKNPQPILLDLAPDHQVTSPFRNPKTPRNLSTLRAELRKFLPHRLADRWLDLHMPTSWTNQALADFENQLHAWTIFPAGTEGYDKAEVTAGGIDTSELSAKTMESRKVPCLFFIGEVVDVTGHLGGFNFQWAWSSGAAAGRAL